MRTLVTGRGPFEPGIFTMLALARHLSDFEVSFSAEVPPGAVALYERIDPLSANVSCPPGSARWFDVDGVKRQNGLPFGTAGNLWRFLGLELGERAARSVGVATEDWGKKGSNYDRYNGAIGLDLICEQVDRTLISGLDIYDPLVHRFEKELARTPYPRRNYADVHSCGPKYERTMLEARLGKETVKIQVDGFVGDLLELRSHQSGRLWRGSWEKSIDEFSFAAWSILQSHVKGAVIRHWSGISSDEIPDMQREIENAVRASLNRGFPSIH